MSEIKTPFSEKRKPLHELLPLSQPLRVEIDPADMCNFKCDFCFQKLDSRFVGRLMTEDIFETIVSQLKEFNEPIKKVYLYALGEPLLNKKVPHFIKRLREENVAEIIAITSNGTMLTHELSEQLIENGLNQLSISVNGLCDDDFKRICHADVNFEKYISEIKYFNEIKGDDCYLHCKLEGDYFTKDEHEKFYEIFGDICDTMHIDNVADIWPDMPIEKNSNVYGLKNDVKPVCPQPFYELCVHSDGTVTPCCAIWNYRKDNIGNIKDKTLKEIWNSKILREICMYQLDKSINTSFDVCKRCKFAQGGASVNLADYRDELIEKYSMN